MTHCPTPPTLKGDDPELLHKGLAALWHKNDPKGVRGDLVDRVKRRLSAINAAQDLRELGVPGWKLHGEPVRYALSVNGPWRITFEWEDGEAIRVALEQYH